jgi:hypothetical protein
MAIEAQGTVIAISSGSGGAETITEIALSHPTILTAAAHGIVNGDVLALADFAGADAALLNGETAVASHVTTNTFAVSIDTTSQDVTDNADAATATPVAYTAIGEVNSWDGPSGSANMYETTHLGSSAKEKQIGLPDEGQVTLSINWIQDTDAGQQAAAAARTARTSRTFKITFSDASTATFTGYVLGLTSSGGVDDKVAGSITIEITGAVVWA